ncbi:MAG: hypothetical protein LZF62_360044 [Nitrospira sp.]|nr:MAG: hypothetical protein LZF62_360044 [Nitrospira sp.]
MVVADVEWAGAGTKLGPFLYTYSGAADRVAPAFFLPCCPLSGLQGHQVACPCFPKIEI